MSRPPCAHPPRTHDVDATQQVNLISPLASTPTPGGTPGDGAHRQHSPLDEGGAPGRIERSHLSRSDLSPSPAPGEMRGMRNGHDRYMHVEHPSSFASADRVHTAGGGTDWMPIGAGPLGSFEEQGRPAQPGFLATSAGGGDTALGAELQMRTKQVSEMQAKLAEATRKVELAGHQALQDKATHLKLASQKAERDRRIETLEATVAQEKSTTVQHQCCKR